MGAQRPRPRGEPRRDRRPSLSQSYKPGTALVPKLGRSLHGAAHADDRPSLRHHARPRRAGDGLVVAGRRLAPLPGRRDRRGALARPARRDDDRRQPDDVGERAGRRSRTCASPRSDDGWTFWASPDGPPAGAVSPGRERRRSARCSPIRSTSSRRASSTGAKATSCSRASRERSRTSPRRSSGASREGTAADCPGPPPVDSTPRRTTSIGAFAVPAPAPGFVMTDSISPSRRWLALGVVCLGVLMVVLDVTIVNVALPSIRADLGFSETTLVWVVNAYLLTCGGFLLLGGRLGDLYGHRRVFVVGIVVFTGASLACGVASAQLPLVVARAVQGIGGAIVDSVALALLMALFTEAGERARAMGVYGFVCAGGGSIGVLLGGVLTDVYDWHWVFLVNLPIGVAVVALSVALLPGAATRQEPGAPRRRRRRHGDRRADARRLRDRRRQRGRLGIDADARPARRRGRAARDLPGDRGARRRAADAARACSARPRSTPPTRSASSGRRRCSPGSSSRRSTCSASSARARCRSASPSCRRT